MDNKKVVGYYNYTVILTYTGMLVAFYGILNAIGGNFLRSIICLMIAGLSDAFDGKIAATRDRDEYEKHFGIQIDSLCDLISFGALPAVFVYCITGGSRPVSAIGGIYLLCALIRLGFYNVNEYERQKNTDERRSVYTGVPVTVVAGLLPLTFLLYNKISGIGETVFPIVLIVLAIGFVSGIKIKKPSCLL